MFYSSRSCLTLTAKSIRTKFMHLKKIILSAPDIFIGDAIGNHCFELSRIFQKFDVPFELYADNFAGKIYDRSSLLKNLKKDDTLFVSFSIYDRLLSQVSLVQNKKICYFHGITPSIYLQECDPIAAKLCDDGMLQIGMLNRFDVVICNSLKTAVMLDGLVQKNKIKVFPPITKSLINCGDEISHSINKSFGIAVIGRVVPHKKIENAIEIINKVRDFNDDFTLHIIGSDCNAIYKGRLEKQVADLNLGAYVQFHGFLEEEVKVSLLKSCSLLLSTSKHEGYGVPIMEAMASGIPVLVEKNSIDSSAFQSKFLEFCDIKSASHIIINLMRDKKLWGKISNEVFEFANSELELVSDINTFDFYRKCLT